MLFRKGWSTLASSRASADQLATPASPWNLSKNTHTLQTSLGKLTLSTSLPSAHVQKLIRGQSIRHVKKERARITMNGESDQMIHPKTNSPAEFIPIQTLLEGEFKRFPRVSMTLRHRNAIKTQRSWRGTHGVTARPRPADSPAHSLARRALVDRMRREERDGLRCLRYPAARAPVGVSCSRRAVCARYCGRTLHGPKVRPENLRALRRRWAMWL